MILGIEAEGMQKRVFVAWEEGVVFLGIGARDERGHTGVVHVDDAVEVEEAVVHVRAGSADVAEGGGAEAADVFGVFGDVVATEVLKFSAVVAEAEVVELIVGEGGAVVAVHAAAGGAENIQAADSGVGECVGFAVEKVIEGGAAGELGDAALKGRDGAGGVVGGDGVGAKGIFEHPAVVGQRVEALFDDFEVAAHFIVGDDGRVELVFEVGCAAVPEEGFGVGREEDARGVAMEGRAVMAERGGAAIRPGEVGVVTTGAGDLAAAGEARVEEESFAEGFFFFGVGVVFGVFGRREQAEFAGRHTGINVRLRPRGGGLRIKIAENISSKAIFTIGLLRTWRGVGLTQSIRTRWKKDW